MDKETLVKIFSYHNPERKDVTNKQYATRLYALSRAFDDDTDEFLNEPEKVFDYLSQKAKTTYGNVLYSIIGYLEAKDKDELSKVYRTRKEHVDEQIANNYQKNKFFGHQEENIISYSELVKFVERMDELVEKEDIASNAVYSNPESVMKETKMVRLLLRLYLRFPSRNEYSSLKFISLVNYKKLVRIGGEKEDNFIVMKSQGNPMLSVADYKTSKKYGVKVQEVDDKEVRLLLTKYYKEIGEEYLFTYTRSGKRWEKYYVSQMLSKWSKLVIGKNLGTTIIYKIIIQEASKEYKRALDDDDFYTSDHWRLLLSKYSKSRGHSRAIQKAVYSKEESPV